MAMGQDRDPKNPVRLKDKCLPKPVVTHHQILFFSSAESVQELMFRWAIGRQEHTAASRFWDPDGWKLHWLLSVSSGSGTVTTWGTLLTIKNLVGT